MHKTTKIYNETLLVEEAEWFHDQMPCGLQPELFVQTAPIPEKSMDGRNDWMNEAQRKEFEAKFK